MKWCHHLYNPETVISELGDYSGVTLMKKKKDTFNDMELGENSEVH